jgi:hypothetical protein
MSQGEYGLSEEARRGLEAIARKHGFTLKKLTEPGKFKSLCAARKECYRYLWDERGWSTTQIARLFNRDHTTVVWFLNNKGQRAARLERGRQRYALIKAAGERRTA